MNLLGQGSETIRFQKKKSETIQFQKKKSETIRFQKKKSETIHHQDHRITSNARIIWPNDHGLIYWPDFDGLEFHVGLPTHGAGM
jgi:hypothetical protein